MRLVEDAEGAAEIASNPNFISETEMTELFKGHAATFKKRIAQIENEAVLERILEIAELEETKASVAQLKAIEHRVEEVRLASGRPPVNRVRSAGMVGSPTPIPSTPT